jgi:hypothetical protein
LLHLERAAAARWAVWEEGDANGGRRRRRTARRSGANRAFVLPIRPKRRLQCLSLYLERPFCWPLASIACMPQSWAS